VSLVCVIVTSGASAAVYLERKVANLRLGMVLELTEYLGLAEPHLVDQLAVPQAVVEVLESGA